MARVLPEIKVTLSRVFPGERAVPHNYPQSVGISTKLGGKPDWIQSSEIPVCSTCNQEMVFTGQIDSVEHQNKLNPLARNPVTDLQDYMFGDVGKIYVFFCYECLYSESVFQCY